MKFLDILSKLSLIMIFILLLIGLNKIGKTEKSEGRFYEYKDSKINLQTVRKIVPRVDYIITYKGDVYDDIFKKHSLSLNEKEIQNIDTLLRKVLTSEYYSVEIAAYMLLDNEKVELYHSERYLKFASEYKVSDGMLEKLYAYGLDDLQAKNLSKIKDKVYENPKDFFEDVVSYAKLNVSAWSRENIPKFGLDSSANKFMNGLSVDATEHNLTVESVESIKKSLLEAYNVYDGIK